MKFINFSKIPVFYFSISFFNPSAELISDFSVNMSLVLWICSILSFGYLDYLCRELTFLRSRSERLVYFNNRLMALSVLSLVSFMLIQIFYFVYYWNSDYSVLKILVVITAFGLFIKNAFANIMRSLGSFGYLFLISFFEFAVFLSVGVCIIAFSFWNTSSLFVILGISGFILIIIFSLIFGWKSINFSFVLHDFCNVKSVTSFLYMNVFWASSYLIKTSFGELGKLDIYFLDFLFLAFFPLFAMVISHLHIKNYIDRSSGRLYFFCFVGVVTICLLSFLLYFIFSSKYYSLLVALFSLLVMIEIFGFNHLIFGILGVYGSMLITVFMTNVVLPFDILFLVFWIIICIYPIVRQNLEKDKYRDRE